MSNGGPASSGYQRESVPPIGNGSSRPRATPDGQRFTRHPHHLQPVAAAATHPGPSCRASSTSKALGLQTIHPPFALSRKNDLPLAKSKDRIVERGLFTPELLPNLLLAHPLIEPLRHNAENLPVTLLLGPVVEVVAIVAIPDQLHRAAMAQCPGENVFLIDQGVSVNCERRIRELLNKVWISLGKERKPMLCLRCHRRCLGVRLVGSFDPEVDHRVDFAL